MARTFVFTGSDLDRDHIRRGDEAWLGERLTDASARIVPVWRDKVLVMNSGELRPVMLPGAESGGLHEHAGEMVYLGNDGETAYFVADLSEMEEPHAEAPHADWPADAAFEDLRRVAPAIEHSMASLLAYARALAYWHRTHRFCGTCGAPTESRQGGHERHCTNAECGKTTYPRTDPAVIMLVTLGEGPDARALLAHNKRFPSGLRYSTVAGFVEPGETLEAAVAREVKEETDIDVADVTYQASQPWPFPASIMLGFRARAVSTDIHLADGELVDAQWFTRDEVHVMGEEKDMLPPSKFSISRWLIDTWLDEEA